MHNASSNRAGIYTDRPTITGGALSHATGIDRTLYHRLLDASSNLSVQLIYHVVEGVFGFLKGFPA